MMAQVHHEPATALAPPAAASESFLACLSRARLEARPFDHWLLEDALPEGYCQAIASLPFEPPQGALFDGKRETNNATRVYFTPDNQTRFEVCRRVVDCFQDRVVRTAIETVTGADLSDAYLRIEYCQDTEGFWLEPHTDITVKRFTMLIYLSADPGLENAGTDLHEGPPDFRYVGSAPYGRNKGLIFVPAKDTWHGVGHHPIEGVRKSIIVNYVTADWRDKWELA